MFLNNRLSGQSRIQLQFYPRTESKCSDQASEPSPLYQSESMVAAPKRAQDNFRFLPTPPFPEAEVGSWFQTSCECCRAVACRVASRRPSALHEKMNSPR